MRAYVVDLWGRGLDAIASGDWSGVDTELDIAIKRKLLDVVLRAHRGDPALIRAWLGSSCRTPISPPQGLCERMERAGLMRRLTTVEGVFAARTTVAPATTRAHLRGRIIAAAEDARADLSVDWVHVRLDDSSAIPLSLQDPLATSDPRVDGLIAQIDASVSYDSRMSPESTSTESRAVSARTRLLPARSCAVRSAPAASLAQLSSCVIVLAVVLIAAGGGLAWWAFHPVPAATRQARGRRRDAVHNSWARSTASAVSGRVGATPTIEIKAPLEIDGFKARVLRRAAVVRSPKAHPSSSPSRAFRRNERHACSPSPAAPR